jgi:hypothetical protein
MNWCVRDVTHHTCAVVPTLCGFPQHIIDSNQLLHKIDVLISALIRRCKYWYGFHFKSFSTGNLHVFMGWDSNFCSSHFSLHISMYTPISGDLQNVSVSVIRLVTRCRIQATVLSRTAILCIWHVFCQQEDIRVAPHSSQTFFVHPKSIQTCLLI